MLGRFFRLLFALLVSQTLLFFLGLFMLGVLVAARHEGPPTVQAHSALSVRLSGELIEYPTLPVLPFLNEVPVSQTHILECIDRASHDDHIDAVLLDLDSPSLGWGMAYELRTALQRFRASGKIIYAYADQFDETSLYLATACDSLFIPPYGKVVVNGLAFGAMYYKGLFDKLGVHANVHKIGAYKSAAEPFIRGDMSPAARANAGWLLDGIWTEFQRTLATDRKLDPEAVTAVLARGTLQPDEAVKAGLIDGARHRGALRQRFTVDREERIVPVSSYRKLAARTSHHGSTIAVVHVRGFILGGKNAFDPVVGTVLGEDSAVRDLGAAARQDNIKAIVLRIDSPGGDVLASDAIAQAVDQARAQKPVVVSMVDVAASGGYMIAYRASRIVALPTTITGSIGSITGKLALRGLYDKLGLTKDFVTRGSYPFLYSDYSNWSAREESLVVRQHWQDYRRWIADVAEHRKLTVAEVDSLGRGRVWSGAQAREHQLIDEIGDLQRAIEVACELSHAGDAKDARLVHYPKETGLLDVIEERSALLSALAERWSHTAQMSRRGAWAVLDLNLEP